MADRETIKCAHCKLVQFRTAKDVCRKCGVSTAPPPAPVVEAIEPFEPLPPCPPHTSLAKAVSFVLRLHRVGRGWSQAQVARRFGVGKTPCLGRTYISKVENSVWIPTLGNLQRFAYAYKISLPALILEIEVAQSILEGNDAVTQT